MKKYLLVLSFFMSFLFIACSAVPTTRYEKNPKVEKSQESKDEEKKTEISKTSEKLNEDYDISKFNPKLDVKEVKKPKQEKIKKEIWYSFPSKPEGNKNSNNEKIARTSDGYRILVFSTDDLEELDEVKSKLEDFKGVNQIYSIFEPPFYKLYLGDFVLLDDANSIRRKLIQLGFNESKVIRTTVNIFE